MNATEFKRRFLTCHRKLYAVAFRLTGNTQDAEDVTQEAYLRLWSRRDQLDKVERPDVYGMVLVRNLCYDRGHRLRGPNSPTAPEDLQLPADTDLHRETEYKDEAHLLNSLIDCLPDTQRTVMQMRDIDGYAYDEIEAATGLTSSNVRTLLCRARQQIREQFRRLTRYENK